MGADFLIRRANLPLSSPYVAPEDEFELLLAKIFAEVFSLDHVGIDDDFYELGGDSLLAEVLSLAISDRTGHSFGISSLFKHGSPRRIAALLKPKSNESVA
jgi:acyl carrier protein